MIHSLFKTNRSWMRDSGQLFYNGKEEKLHFNFNGWAKIKLPIRQNVPAAVASFKLATNTSDAQGKPVIVEGDHRQ
jgi:agmatine/peptidylarginine deiminase